VTQTARLIVGNKPVTIMDAASPKPFFIHGDRGKIKKIMMEIVINAAKFTHRGRVAVIIDKEDDRMNMTVTDTGIGMSTEHIRAFFPSAENKKEEVSIGMPITGSGLLIARSLVNLLKGSITASSKLKEGTIVEVSLPIKQQVARIHTLAHAQ
jgi:signal transduction histidine kinase